MRSRVHIKMLSGDYPCSYYLASDRNQDPSCVLCKHLPHHGPVPAEDMVHLLTQCRATSETRIRVIAELLNILAVYCPGNTILLNPNHTQLTQLILDPTSLNLPTTIRVSQDHPALPSVLEASRTVCYAIHKDRTRQLKALSKT